MDIVMALDFIKEYRRRYPNLFSEKETDNLHIGLGIEKAKAQRRNDREISSDKPNA